MPTLTNILLQRTDLVEEERKWLHLLTGDWQILADIMFADILLAVPTSDGYMIAAQARSATASTLFETDIVGSIAALDYQQGIAEALESGEAFTWGDEEVEVSYVPVVHQGKSIAVTLIVSAIISDRVLTQAQQNYEDIAMQLRKMIASGDFPFAETPSAYRHGTPRVTDGVVHMNEEGVVLYASPNAVSHFRRLGIEESTVGRVLAELITERLDEFSQVDESLPLVLMGRAAWMSEVESPTAIISMRAIPLRLRGERFGAMLMVRDISELRRQERELITKDATIREIHHRVKNNLQTVSALLRLQSRRAESPETKAALDTAQRRVATIAIVHERLSQNIDEVVDFDELFIPVLRMSADIAGTGSRVETSFVGSFGKVRAEQATALSVVLNEVIANAAEHGVPHGGTISVSAVRDDDALQVVVSDDGEGIDPDGPGQGLGTQIVRTMVATELHGRITWTPARESGTIVKLDLRID